MLLIPQAKAPIQICLRKIYRELVRIIIKSKIEVIAWLEAS